MSMHTYIGARYVPKFVGTYDVTQSYDALDVVDNGSGTSYISDVIDCDASRTCSISVVVNDDLSSGTDDASLPIAFTLMEFYNTGRGVAFGKVATRDGLDCAMPAYFTGGVYIDGKPLAEYIADITKG